MCNYYGRHRPASELQKAFGFVDPIPNLEPRYVVRPTDTERVVAIGKDGARHFPAMHWGLVPVDCFYEFTGPKGQKQPHLFRPKDGP
jgi:putative SOS response-associated peptidase YedK